MILANVLTGEGVIKNYAEALKWAYKDLGIFKSYFKDLIDYFIEVDEAELLKIYNNSNEEAGKALYKLAMTCPKIFIVKDQEEELENDESDDDVKKDTPEINQEYLNKSSKILKRAVDLGSTEAMHEMARIYKGAGILFEIVSTR